MPTQLNSMGFIGHVVLGNRELAKKPMKGFYQMLYNFRTFRLSDFHTSQNDDNEKNNVDVNSGGIRRRHHKPILWDQKYNIRRKTNK